MTNTTSAANTKLSAASSLATKICQRSVERVRIVFSVPWLSSDDTMSPATSDVMSGNSQTELNSRPTSGTASPVSLTKRPNGTSSGPPLLDSSAITKISGTSAAAPRPR